MQGVLVLGAQAEASVFRNFTIGGVRVCVRGGSIEDVRLLPPLARFASQESEYDVGVDVEWVSSIRRLDGRKTFDSATTWRLYECDDVLEFDFISVFRSPHPYKRLVVDRAYQRAALQMSEECLADLDSPDPLGYPLDELLIMHRLTQERAIELHGCGIVRADGVGNLFVGHSGAGKSTTTRLWTEREDVEVLSDDRIIVRRDEVRVVRTPRQAAGDAGKHEVLRLRETCASRTSPSAQDDNEGKMRMYGTPWHGEAMYASPHSAPLERIFILEHGHGNVVTPLSTSQAVAELFARSFVPFHRHEYVESALSFLQELVEAVPVYRYAFEPDARAVEVVANFRD